MAFVIHESAGARRQLSRVAGDRLRIGRGAGADLRLDAAAVALEHAEIERRGESYWLRDRDSVTGSYLNGDPIEEHVLADGDWIGIGPYRLRVALRAGEPLRLTLEEVAGTPAVDDRPAAAVRNTVRPAAAPKATTKADPVDYAAAYRLRHGCLSKSGSSALGAGAVLLLLAYISLAGHLRLVSPGPISEDHQTAATGCLDCHAPWRGPVESGCEGCHRVDPHEQVATVHAACADCHPEHRGPQNLRRAASAQCVSCHSDLPLRPGAVTAVARSVPTFDAHPPFQPLPDTSTLRFNHNVHLTPRVGLRELACTDCHQMQPAGTMAPIRFEAHCADCHELVIDPRFAETAVHGPPIEAIRSVYGSYLGNFDELAGLTREELIRRIFRRGQTALSASEATERAAFTAATRLLEDQCSKCHPIEVISLANVRLEAPVQVARWMTTARFSHLPHAAMDCTSCHVGVERSRETADVLLPAIDQCLSCHGTTPAVDAPLAVRAGSPCATCHDYHPTIPVTEQRQARWSTSAGQPGGSRR